MRNIRWLGLGALVLVVLLAANELRPVGAVAASQAIAASSQAGTTSPPVPWPSGAQAAIGAGASGVAAATPGARAEPIASVAKVMTALVTLKLKPLDLGQDGPAITVSADDVAEYQQDQAATQSVVPVQQGEQLTEKQALEALLIPSGNNIAGLLARWAAGSEDAMVERMNAAARSMGLAHTRFADVSGFSDQTVSVPADLVVLGEQAMAVPVIASVVGMQQVKLPVAGTAYNVNYALGTDGILGIKTGNIPEVGAVYLFAADGTVGGRNEQIVGAVQGLPTLDLAFSAARTLLDAAKASLVIQHVVSKNQTVGRYTTPWGAATDIVAADDLDVIVWPGTVIRSTLAATPLRAPLAASSAMGSLHVTGAESSWDVPITNGAAVDAPSWQARLTRVTW